MQAMAEERMEDVDLSQPLKKINIRPQLACRPDCMEKEIVHPAQGQGNEGLRFGSLHEEPGSKCKGAMNR